MVTFDVIVEGEQLLFPTTFLELLFIAQNNSLKPMSTKLLAFDTSAKGVERS